MTAKKFETVGELIFYAYANLAMAHSAITKTRHVYQSLISDALWKKCNKI
jgi:phosphoribosyl-AMP cyclohydrolase